MRAQTLWRKVHLWLSIVAAVPILIMICTGLLLQLKKELHWIQPDEQRGTAGAPRVSFDEILTACIELPQPEVRSWADVKRVDFDPADALVKVATHDGWEIQLDPADARVLQVALRRSDLIEGLHDGSWFAGFAKHWVFLPAGIALLILWLTGIYLFFVPLLRRRPRARNAGREP